MTDVETRLFRYFVTLAEERHFARAAQRLKLTPPTLTHQIKKLESDLDVKLLERGGNTHVQLTDAGERFLERARVVLHEVDEAARIVRQAARGEIGQIRIAYQYVVICADILQPLIKRFQKDNPAVEIVLDHMVTLQQMSGLLKNEIDIGFARPPRRYPAGLRGINIYRQPMVLAVPANHPLARKKSVTPAEMGSAIFVNPPFENDLGFTQHAEALGALGNFAPKIRKRAVDIFTVLTYVSAGYGIAAVSESMTKVSLPNVVYRKIDSPNAPHTVVTVLHRAGESAPINKLFLALARKHALRS